MDDDGRDGYDPHVGRGHALRGGRQRDDAVQRGGGGRNGGTRDLGRDLASGSFDKSIIVWDVAKGDKVHTLNGHTGYVRSVCSLAGNRLASGSDDKSIIVWDDRKLQDKTQPKTGSDASTHNAGATETSPAALTVNTPQQEQSAKEEPLSA